MKTEYETVRYHLVYSELVQAALKRGTVLYSDLARIVGFRHEATGTTKRINVILLAVSQNEVTNERPMLSALVVKAKGIVPKSFFTHAHNLGLDVGSTADEEMAFWLRQKDACYRTWQQYLMDDYNAADY